jgi:lipopolysaccharide export system protein LptC
MGKGIVTSEEHVDVKLTNGTLTADKLRITGGGEVVRFEGNVVMNLDKLPPAETPPSAEEAPAPVHSAKDPANKDPAKPHAPSGKTGHPK